MSNSESNMNISGLSPGVPLEPPFFLKTAQERDRLLEEEQCGCDLRNRKQNVSFKPDASGTWVCVDRNTPRTVNLSTDERQTLGASPDSRIYYAKYEQWNCFNRRVESKVKLPIPSDAHERSIDAVAHPRRYHQDDGTCEPRHQLALGNCRYSLKQHTVLEEYRGPNGAYAYRQIGFRIQRAGKHEDLCLNGELGREQLMHPELRNWFTKRSEIGLPRDVIITEFRKRMGSDIPKPSPQLNVLKSYPSDAAIDAFLYTIAKGGHQRDDRAGDTDDDDNDEYEPSSQAPRKRRGRPPQTRPSQRARLADNHDDQGMADEPSSQLSLFD
ncbi:hypothetical protein CAOG_007275 [Capsaspora owczarzaki ATCC 30864]|uniref:Uncharacterized protein n=2 Tax=Capsaspora owczarzaki (strain ATCC 30864) TaxID=595528 RepID=A0A0D2VZU9_CAPO3|nr:hypothetical protein CAOG_007275 [Capsaspora owczarzaki ATCC 30864]